MTIFNLLKMKDTVLNIRYEILSSFEITIF